MKFFAASLFALFAVTANAQDASANVDVTVNLSVDELACQTKWMAALGSAAAAAAEKEADDACVDAKLEIYTGTCKDNDEATKSACISAQTELCRVEASSAMCGALKEAEGCCDLELYQEACKCSESGAAATAISAAVALGAAAMLM
eukprot:GDKI01036871.1.p2 GENE.GDKI01036871.1~~GDKI01036871.1.p2  ORF type:complete len:147 (-),score=49.57 GDKI01036871.1:397-837(-)